MGYAYQTASADGYALLKERAKGKRQHPTQAESLLWQYLRREDREWRFKRQHIIGNFIADFVSLEKSLVIEVDGGYHKGREQMERDEERSHALRQMGFEVIHFTNEEVLTSIETVIDTIMEEMESR